MKLQILFIRTDGNPIDAKGFDQMIIVDIFQEYEINILIAI